VTDNGGLTYDEIFSITVSDVEGNFVGTPAGDSITGSSEDDGISGLAGNDTLIGGTGDDTIDGGAGADTLTGDAGADRFVFSAGTGTDGDVISDFSDGEDLIDLTSFGLSNVGDLTIMNDGGGNAVITLPSGDSITVTGVDQSALTDSDFVF
ncbi:MAG: calcium-binding protein, partial [bacterium]|nr:calcium-binding protein [bacterium]